MTALIASDVKVRAFATEVEWDAKRRTLDGMFVPYGEVARVADILPDGRADVYQEGFRPGVFARQLAADPGRLRQIEFHHGHGTDGLGFLGSTVSMAESDGGVHGTLRVIRSRADDVADLVEDGIDGLSIEFRLALRDGEQIDADGVRWRTSAVLDRVALVPIGAYTGARVLAFRSGLSDEDIAELTGIDPTDTPTATIETPPPPTLTRSVFDELDEWVADAQRAQDALRNRYQPATTGGN